MKKMSDEYKGVKMLSMNGYDLKITCHGCPE